MLEVVREIRELKTLVVEGMEALQEMMEFQEREYERLRERFEEEIDEGYFQVEEDGSDIGSVSWHGFYPYLLPSR